jgi:hypothetical protein
MKLYKKDWQEKALDLWDQFKRQEVPIALYTFEPDLIEDILGDPEEQNKAICEAIRRVRPAAYVVFKAVDIGSCEDGSPTEDSIHQYVLTMESQSREGDSLNRWAVYLDGQGYCEQTDCDPEESLHAPARMAALRGEKLYAVVGKYDDRGEIVLPASLTQQEAMELAIDAIVQMYKDRGCVFDDELEALRDEIRARVCRLEEVTIVSPNPTYVEERLMEPGLWVPMTAIVRDRPHEGGDEFIPKATPPFRFRLFSEGENLIGIPREYISPIRRDCQEKNLGIAGRDEDLA